MPESGIAGRRKHEPLVRQPIQSDRYRESWPKPTDQKTLDAQRESVLLQEMPGQSRDRARPVQGYGQGSLQGAGVMLEACSTGRNLSMNRKVLPTEESSESIEIVALKVQR